jgi:hypothetical protein
MLHEHVQACRLCLRRIQELDETIYGIAERTDSGIATVYSTIAPDAQPRRAAPRHSDAACRDRAETDEIAKSIADSYPEYPIQVQVIRGRPPQAVAKAAWKRAACNPQVRFLLKTAVAAAAVIPLALIFLNTSTASGTTLAQVFKAFGNAPNVHVAKFYPNTGQLVQELWISRATNRVLITGGQERVLYDLGERKRLVHPTPGGSADAMDLSDRQSANARQSTDACLGFTLGDIPPGAKWTRVHDDVVVGEDIEAYELTYTEGSRAGNVFLWNWRITIDPLTMLPRESEGFRKLADEAEWHPMLRTELQYLTEDEMMTAITSH